LTARYGGARYRNRSDSSSGSVTSEQLLVERVDPTPKRSRDIVAERYFVRVSISNRRAPVYIADDRYAFSETERLHLACAATSRRPVRIRHAAFIDVALSARICPTCVPGIIGVFVADRLRIIDRWPARIQPTDRLLFARISLTPSKRVGGAFVAGRRRFAISSGIYAERPVYGEASTRRRSRGKQNPFGFRDTGRRVVRKRDDLRYGTSPAAANAYPSRCGRADAGTVRRGK